MPDPAELAGPRRDAVEDDYGHPGEPFIAVDQWVIAGDRLEEDRRLGVQIRVGIVAEQRCLRPVGGGVQQT